MHCTVVTFNMKKLHFEYYLLEVSHTTSDEFGTALNFWLYGSTIDKLQNGLTFIASKALDSIGPL